MYLYISISAIVMSTTAARQATSVVYDSFALNNNYYAHK